MHSLVIEEDTVAFHVVEGPLIVLNDRDGIDGMWDWKSTQITWRQALAEMGLAPTAWRPDRS